MGEEVVAGVGWEEGGKSSFFFISRWEEFLLALGWDVHYAVLARSNCLKC